MEDFPGTDSARREVSEVASRVFGVGVIYLKRKVVVGRFNQYEVLISFLNKTSQTNTSDP
jgi:hypothetical protein